MPYFACVKIIYFRWPAVLCTYLLITKHGGVIYSVTKATCTLLILLTPINMIQRYVPWMKIYSESTPWKKQAILLVLLISLDFNTRVIQFSDEEKYWFWQHPVIIVRMRNAYFSKNKNKMNIILFLDRYRYL